MMRRAVAFAHRWVALVAGSVLALLGLTGTLMVWQAELDAALNPAWFAPSARCAPTDRPIETVLRVLSRAAPGARASTVVAPATPGAAYIVWEPRDPRTGWRREHFIDPACASYLGQRDRGAWRLDAAHAVPLLYELHSRLLAGQAGHLAAGAVALVMLGLALSGGVLAWPRGGRAGWRRALGVKRGAAPARWWYDLHRAMGWWLMPVALLIGATGAALVFDGAARAAVAAVLPVERLPRLAKSAAPAEAVASPVQPDRLVGEAERAFASARWTRLTLPATPGGPAEVRLLQAGEPRADTGATRLRLGPSGQILARHDALAGPAGNLVLDWVFPLHSAEALGLPARLLWTLFGLAPVAWLGSGLWLWWRRRRKA